MLQGLDKERRALGGGPQVLHLAKTRKLFEIFIEFYSLFNTDIVFARP